MVERLSRKVYNALVGNPEHRKAVAFAIYLKDHKQTSVVKNWSYRELSRISGIAPGTCKKRIAALRELGLVKEETKNGVRYLVFRKLRAPKMATKRKLGLWYTPKRQDVSLKKVGRFSVKAIEMGLIALYVVETQTKKNFIRQTIRSKDKGRKVAEIKRAKKICRGRGWKEYSEFGLSYRGMAGKLNVGTAKMLDAVRYGESKKMFTKQKSDLVQLFVGKGRGKEALEFVGGFHFATSSNLYRQPANVYLLHQA